MPNAIDPDVLSSLPAPAMNVPKIPLPPPKPSRRYHVGLRPGGPAWNHNVAGVSLPVTNSFYDEAGTEFKKSGTVVDLDTEQLKRFRDTLSHQVVRWRQGKDRKTGEVKRIGAEIWDDRIVNFHPERNDEPLEPYVFFEPIRDEFVQPPVQQGVTRLIDDAIRDAEKSESKAIQDPRDARTRDKHGAAKAMGAKLEPENL